MTIAMIKAALGKAMPTKRGPHGGYFDDGSRVTPTRAESITPHLDHARQMAGIWKCVACGTFLFTLAGWGAFVWQTQISTVALYTVEVDKYGEPGQIQELKTYSPTTDRYRWVVQQSVIDAFAISTDHLINRDRYDRLRMVLGGDATKAWSDWWQSNKDALPAARVVKIITSRPTANPNVWLVSWTETDFQTVADYLSNKPKYPVRRLSGEFTLQYRKWKNSTEMTDNVFGIWVTGMNWSPEENGR